MKLYSPVISGSLTVTGSTTFIGNITMSGSLSATASNALLLNGTGSVGFTTTGSFTTMSGSVSTRVSQIESVYATTGSNSFRATQSITGSLTVTGQIIAQTLNVQQVTSSIVFSSGSNVFGCDLNSRQTFTGSVNITGSITQTGANTTASFASSVAIGTNTIINRLTLSGGSDGLTNMLGVYNNGINNTTAIGKGSAIILGGNTDGNYSAKIAMVYEGQNPSYLQPALTFYTMRDTFAYGSEVERMRITSAGNVGIGTCTPTGTYGKLSVAGGISILNDNNAKLEIGRFSSGASNSYIKIGSNSNSLRITNAADSVDLVTFENCGNVGIGTCSPSGAGMVLNVKGITGNTIGMVIAESADGCAMVSLYSGSGIGDDPSLIYLKDLRFGSGNKSTAGYVERMRITNCGNLGIGLTCPVETLDIMGSLRVRCNTPSFTNACNSLVIDYANTCVFGSSPMTRYYSVGCTGISAGHSFLVGQPSAPFNAFIIGGTGNIQKPCSAAFHAAVNSSTCIGPGGTMIKFNNVIYNAGGGYNGTTSTFTAPVSGMYQFNFTFLNQNVQNVDGGHSYLSTNFGVGTYYFTRYGCFSGTDRTGYGAYVPMHGAIAIYLPAGCKACVGAFWDGPGAFTHNSDAWSNFTGYLVG